MKEKSWLSLSRRHCQSTIQGVGAAGWGLMSPSLFLCWNAVWLDGHGLISRQTQVLWVRGSKGLVMWKRHFLWGPPCLLTPQSSYCPRPRMAPSLEDGGCERPICGRAPHRCWSSALTGCEHLLSHRLLSRQPSLGSLCGWRDVLRGPFGTKPVWKLMLPCPQRKYCFFLRHYL